MRILFLCFMLMMSGVHAQNLYSFESSRQEAQFEHLLKELRCLVCQNQDLSDSHAQLAKDLRQQVYELVKIGKSDTEIHHFLTDRYGDFILFNPPVKPVTWMLWFGPLLFLLTGFYIFWRSCLKRVVVCSN